ncbi:hypothetical protein ACLB2K_011694 [Fragaria x ananassa]
MDDNDEIDETYDDAKYHDIPYLDEEDRLNKDSKREWKKNLDDTMIKPKQTDNFKRDKRYDRDENFITLANNINEDVYNSKMYYALKGNDIRFRTVTKADKVYGYYCFVVGFSKRSYKNDKLFIDGVAHVMSRGWSCAKKGFEKSSVNRKQNVVYNEEATTEKQQASEDETPWNKRKKKIKKTVVRGYKYTRTGCETIFVLRLDKMMLYTV